MKMKPRCRYPVAPARAFFRPPYFFPVSGRQNLARRRDFDADDMALGIEIVEKRPGFLGPLDLAAHQRDIHRVGFGIVGYLWHGFHSRSGRTSRL
jgi:hypothetical protein